MWTKLLFVSLALIVVLLPSTGQAGGPPAGGKDRFGNGQQVDVTVTSTPTGVYIQISVREDKPGNTNPAPTPSGPGMPVTAPTPSVPQAATTPTSGGGRWWSDATGIYEQTPDGHLFYLTIPNISSQSDWPAQLQAHPNEMPYVLYIDNQFQKIIWIPNSPSSGQVNFGAPPANAAPAGNPPQGNGGSTDPYQVALDLLDHVPLPNAQIKENPGLGLVHLPGWFWVDGYNGQQFGTSRTVTVPPAVGPEVPFTLVPANDPRRQPTSFTVSVQIWPTSYQWNFGDGTTLITQSLGKAYPSESDIQHTYSFSSLKSPSGFPIQMTVTFAAQYQVTGGGPQGLPPMSHTYTANYLVQEAQAILVSH